MPSPFPGMDPYLEGSEWGSVHAELSSAIARQLAPRLRPKYYVRTVQRFASDLPDEVSGDIGISESDLYPDASIVASQRQPQVAGISVAFQSVSPAIELTTIIPERIREVTVEIRNTREHRLVTGIEVLSPVNKWGAGYREYLEKREKLLRSAAHLIEIDLLRKGRRIPVREQLPEADYFVFLSRANRRPIMQVWALQLKMSLPSIPVPLLPEDPEVVLDLQQAFTTVYDGLDYDLSIDYTQPPDINLSKIQSEWANELLQTAGFHVR